MVSRYFTTMFLIAFFAACSSEKTLELPNKPSSEATGGNQSVTLETGRPAGNTRFSLEISPSEAKRNVTLYLTPQGFNLPDARIEWLVNDTPVVSPAPNHYKVTTLKKGDKVQARALVQGEQIFSNVVGIKNSPPEITKAVILLEALKSGGTLRVDASATDPDDDAVSLTYEWTKNGESIGNAREIRVPLKRGDKISVTITPHDSEIQGLPVILNREITNMPPALIEDKTFHFDGFIYSKQIKATDPDGDPLIYSLKSSPQGMTIDQSTGLIKWNVPAEFKGKAPFTVSVSDGHGGETLQSLALEIRTEQRK